MMYIVLIAVLLILFIFMRDPYTMYVESINSAPSITHLFGTDSFGRDVFSRVVLGIGYSFVLMVVAVGLALTIGVTVGVICSLGPRWLGDRVVMALDFINSVPSIIYILLAASFVEPNIWTIALIIGGCSWMTIARQVRIVLLKERQQAYLLMAKQIGTTKWHRLWHYYVPALYPVLGITAIHESIHVLFAEATISFLGFGLPVNTPTLGNLLIGAQTYFLLGSWWNIVFPAITTMLLTIGLLKMKDLLNGGLQYATYSKFVRFLRQTFNRQKYQSTNITERENFTNGEKWHW